MAHSSPCRAWKPSSACPPPSPGQTHARTRTCRCRDAGIMCMGAMSVLLLELACCSSRAVAEPEEPSMSSSLGCSSCCCCWCCWWWWPAPPAIGDMACTPCIALATPMGRTPPAPKWPPPRPKPRPAAAPSDAPPPCSPAMPLSSPRLGSCLEAGATWRDGLARRTTSGRMAMPMPSCMRVLWRSKYATAASACSRCAYHTNALPLDACAVGQHGQQVKRRMGPALQGLLNASMPTI